MLEMCSPHVNTSMLPAVPVGAADGFAIDAIQIAGEYHQCCVWIGCHVLKLTFQVIEVRWQLLSGVVEVSIDRGDQQASLPVRMRHLTVCRFDKAGVTVTGVDNASTSKQSRARTAASS